MPIEKVNWIELTWHVIAIDKSHGIFQKNPHCVSMKPFFFPRILKIP